MNDPIALRRVFGGPTMKRLKEATKKLGIYPLLKRAKAAANEAVWFNQAVPFYSRFLQPGDLCFDVGANMGSRVAVFLEVGARVIAVEPQDDCVRHMLKRFGPHPNLVLVEKGLAAKPGRMQLSVSDSNTISTMSDSWKEAVTQSGRFADYSWDRVLEVEVITLDALIDWHGVPSFCKIDVEGFELEVLKGLSHPIPYLSFEYTPEMVDTALQCVGWLSRLANYRFNYALGQEMRLVKNDWVSPRAIGEVLLSYATSTTVFADVYAKLSC